MGKLFLISGNEEFSVKERAGTFIHELFGDAPEDNTELEIIRGDDDSEKFGEVLDKFISAIETPAFLSPQKTVWLKHFNKFEDAVGEESSKKKKSRIDIIGEFLKDRFPDDLTVIIDGVGLDRRKAFYKLCEKVCASSGGALEWFEKADPKAKGFAAILSRKIKEIVGAASRRIDENAVAFLAETIGGDAARMKNELDKLISYAGDAKIITLNDCLEICSRSTETISWEFSSALASRNAAKAISLIPSIIETIEQERGSGGRAELAIVGSANSEFQKLLMLKCEGRKLGIPDNASADYFYSLNESQKSAGTNSPILSLHPFRAFKMWENAIRFSDVKMAEVFDAIFDANKGMVTGADPKITLETLVLKITG